MVDRLTGRGIARLSRPYSVWPALAVAAFLLGGCGVFGGDDEALSEASLGDSESVVADTTVLGSDEAGAAGEADAADEAADPLEVTSAASSTASSTVTSVSVETSNSAAATSSTTAATGTTTATASPSTSATSGSTTTTITAPSTTAPGGNSGCRATATICAGPGQQISTLAAAVVAANDGEIIELILGRYNETVAVAADNVTIRSAPGGSSTIDCSGITPAQGKACVLSVGTNLTVENMVVTGARGPDNNEACFRNEPGTRFIVRNVECFGSNNGILGSGGSWLIEDSNFHDNGAGDGFSHNLYLSGDCSEVVFRRSTSERAVGGHAFKSRCLTSVIEGSTLRDNAVGDAAEFSYGGVVTISDTVISQPDGSNGNIVRHGAEGCRHSGSLTFVNATISSGRSPGYIRSACQAVGFNGTELPANIEVAQP